MLRMIGMVRALHLTSHLDEEEWPCCFNFDNIHDRTWSHSECCIINLAVLP